MTCLSFTSFLLTCFIFIVSIVLVTASLKYTLHAKSHNLYPHANLTTLFFYTTFLPVSVLISTLLNILFTHNSLPPPPNLHLILTLLLLTSIIFLTSLQTRCELLLPSLQLPSICPSIIRTTKYPSGESGPEFGKPIWLSVSVFRVCLGVILILLYLALATVVGVEVKREWEEKRNRRKSSIEMASNMGGVPEMMGEYLELREWIGTAERSNGGPMRIPMAMKARQSLMGGEQGIVRLMNFNPRA